MHQLHDEELFFCCIYDFLSCFSVFSHMLRFVEVPCQSCVYFMEAAVTFFPFIYVKKSLSSPTIMVIIAIIISKDDYQSLLQFSSITNHQSSLSVIVISHCYHHCNHHQSLSLAIIINHQSSITNYQSPSIIHIIIITKKIIHL